MPHKGSSINEGCVDLVRAGFSDALTARGEVMGTFSIRCLTFMVNFNVRPKDAFHDLWNALHVVQHYNAFSAKRVIACFRELEDANGIIPGVDSIGLGREYGPVMYIKCCTKERAKELRYAFGSARPDEVHRKGKTIRLWWD